MTTKQKKTEAQAVEDFSEIESLVDECTKPKFRLKNRFLLLTFRTHIDKSELAEWLKKEHGAEVVNICHESGDKCVEYLHTHTVIDFGKSFETTNCRIFDWSAHGSPAEPAIHPHIKKLTYRKAYLDAIRYIRKEDKSVYIEETNLVLNIYDDCMGLTEVEILKKCQKFSEVPGALALSKVIRKNACRLPNITLYPWQKRIVSVMDIEEPGRSIGWFYDDEGATGKSVFAKWMAIKYPTDVLVLQQLGGMKDAATIISGAKDWSGRMLIVDLPRAAETKDIYAPLEAIKNGHLNTIKYEGGSYMWNAGHVIVFANFPPRIDGTWSKDRFNVLCYNPHLNDYVGYDKPLKRVAFAPQALN